MIEWIRSKVQGRSYSEIAKYLAGKIDMPIIVAWIADIAWESYAGREAMEMCLVQAMKNTKQLEMAEKICERWLGMQDFGIPDPIIWAVWGFWLFLIIVYYHNRNKPYPLGPAK